MKYAVALALPLLVAAQTLDKNAVKISNVAYSGNGCPQGTASTTISDDRTVIIPPVSLSGTISRSQVANHLILITT